MGKRLYVGNLPDSATEQDLADKFARAQITVVGAITLYALGYLIWELAFADFFAANAGSATGVVKDPQVIWALALGTLSYAALLTRGTMAYIDTA